jgi:TetR/AcrR family transcriptional regulator, tetracycline repressor protein
MATLSTKERLSRETLAAGALALAEAEGLEAVTIRRLASDHDVTPMALYWHFKDKDAVLDGIAEQIFAGVILPEPTDAPWDVQLRGALLAVLNAVRPHPLVADLLAMRIMKSEGGLELSESVIGLLRTAGFPASQAANTAAYLLCSIVVLVTSEPGHGLPLSEEAADVVYRGKKAQLDSLPPKRFPYLIEATPYMLNCDDEDAYFERGLDFLVAGTRGVVPA